jgi:AraC-like DNA-binding protein
MNYSKSNVDFNYLIINENDFKFGLCVNSVGYQSIKPYSQYPLIEHPEGYFFNAHKGRILNEYQLIYITEGSGKLTLEQNEVVQISKGQAILIFPGQWHSYQPTKSSGWNEYYIGFNGKIIESLVQNSFLSKKYQLLDVGLNEELVNLYKRAIEIVKTDKIATQQHLLGIVMHAIGLILSESKNARSVKNDPKQIVNRTKIFLNENVFKCLYIEELAQKMDVNYTTFRKLFKVATGYAPVRYFHELKIQKAKQLLLETSNSVKEISNMLNYNSPESFISSLKKSIGQTPSKYRADCRQICLD